MTAFDGQDIKSAAFAPTVHATHRSYDLDNYLYRTLERRAVAPRVPALSFLVRHLRCTHLFVRQTWLAVLALHEERLQF